jgi:hypothetical protein
MVCRSLALASEGLMMSGQHPRDAEYAKHTRDSMPPERLGDSVYTMLKEVAKYLKPAMSELERMTWCGYGGAKNLLELLLKGAFWHD